MEIPNSQEEISRLIDELILQTVEQEYQLDGQQQERQQQPSIQQQMQAQGVPSRWNTQVHQQEQQEQQQQQAPNRWSTPVSVKCQTGPIGQVTHRYRYFTDIQMAYIWIKDQTRRSDDSNWTLHTFFETCDAMDSQWQLTQSSEFLVAHSGSTLYSIEYEPSMTFESVRAVNNLDEINAQY
jgi:hypothetical protein